VTYFLSNISFACRINPGNITIHLSLSHKNHLSAESRASAKEWDLNILCNYDAGFLFAFNEGRTPEGRGQCTRARMPAGRVTQEQLPRSNCRNEEDEQKDKWMHKLLCSIPKYREQLIIPDIDTKQTLKPW